VDALTTPEMIASTDHGLPPTGLWYIREVDSQTLLVTWSFSAPGDTGAQADVGGHCLSAALTSIARDRHTPAILRVMESTLRRVLYH
jgi:hypothetical protein